MEHSIEITPIDDQIPLLPQTQIEEERNVDYLIETKETSGEDRSGLQTNKSAKQIFDERFKDLNNKYTTSCTIFRITPSLTESNPDAYKPKLISIGPYHSKNPKLRSMEKYKLMYLQRFLRRKEGIDVESCIRELEELKDKALKCYDDLEDLDFDSNTDQFLQMLFLDGCFVVEYVRESYGIIPVGEGIILNQDCLDNEVRRDLLLLENQLPFFVLTKLHDMTKEDNDEEPFTIMAKEPFHNDLPKITPKSFRETEGNAENIKHLLHLVHMSCYPSEMKTRNSSMRRVEHCRKNLCWNLLQKIRSEEIPINRYEATMYSMMPNVTELCEAGVSFKKVGAIYGDLDHLDEDGLVDRTSLFDIEFENGLMKIPSFQVTDDTEMLLRNLIAYEQQSPEESPSYFSDYALFMDRLLDSEKDVTFLRLKGIIRNTLGEDKEVASFFNKLGKGICLSSGFYYNEECRKAVQHCEKPWNRMKANLKHNYFHSPWAGISTVAAIILLLLTAMQTVLTFISIIK